MIHGLRKLAAMGKKTPAEGSGAAKVMAVFLIEIPTSVASLTIMPGLTRGPTPAAGVDVDQSQIPALQPEARSLVSLPAKNRPVTRNTSVKNKKLWLGKSVISRLRLWLYAWKNGRNRRRQQSRPIRLQGLIISPSRLAEVKAPKARSSVPPMPSKSVPNREPDSDEVSDGDKIPVAILKLVEAELGHTVSFGNKPLTSQSVETRLASAKPPGKSLNAFIVRYGKGKAPPTRNAAKTKMVAALMKELKF